MYLFMSTSLALQIRRTHRRSLRPAVRALAATAIVLTVGCVGGQARNGPTQRPNIVLIVSDDLGYADIGVYGSRDIPTPNIDRIAREGIRFTNAYVSGPYCSPSRAGLMTGRYPQRFGYEFNPDGSPDYGLPLTETTMADRLKAAGYRTALFGKWHLGSADHCTRCVADLKSSMGSSALSIRMWTSTISMWARNCRIRCSTA